MPRFAAAVLVAFSLVVGALVPMRVCAAGPPPHAATGAAPAPAAPGDTAAGGRDSLASAAGARAPARDYRAAVRAAFTPENRAYQSTRIALALIEPLAAIVIGLLLMFTGLSALYRDAAHALGHRRYVRALVYFTLYSVTMFVLGLPLAWYEEFALEHQYGLSTQTLGGWLDDSVKALLFSIVVIGVVPLLALAWNRIEKHPRGWWVWIAAGTIPVAFAAIVLQPVVFEPLFNQFTPLRDAALRTEILALAHRAGIPARHVVQVDMSTKTRKLNAYVSGFGASQRIVLWDTTLERMRRDEILFVMGHEMGHYVLGHVWKSLGWIAIGAFIVFALVAWLADRAIRAWGHLWDVTSVTDLAALPVLVAMLTLVTTLAMPAINGLSRRVEHEADVFGLEITRDNDAAARAFLALAEDNRSDPEPAEWVRVLLYDHPPLGERIRFALSYRPWERGAPNRYFKPRAGR